MAELAGLIVGHYFLLERLGCEGMEETYRARPTTAGGYDVKLRLFSPPFPDPTSFRDHFATEVEKVWRCRHPHIQPLIEFGAGSELLYSATVCAEEEETLANQLETLPRDTLLPLDTALRYVTQIAAALQYAHEQSIVHGNVQPSSIVLGEDGQVLLTDFSMRSMSAGNEVVMARIGEGNPAYLAPEQALGMLRPECDIYALGVLLYRLLGGVLPYDNDDPGELALQHANEPIPPLRPLRPEVPEELEMVVRVALAKSPEARFASAAALAQALIDAVKPRYAEGVASWPKRRIPVRPRRTNVRWMRAASFVALAVLLLGLSSTFFFVFSVPQRIYDLGSQLSSNGWYLSAAGGRPPGGLTVTPSGRSGGSARSRGSSGSVSGGSHRVKPTPTPGIAQTPVINLGSPTPSPTTCAVGAVLLDGPPAIGPLVQHMDSDYIAQCPGAKISTASDDSHAALDLLQQSQINLAVSTLTAQPVRNLTDHAGMALLYALIASPDIQVSSLTTAQLQEIYQGKVTNWSQVGGPNEAISVVLRAPGNSLTALFDEFVLNGAAEQVPGTKPSKDDDALVLQTVGQMTGALSYVPLVAVQQANVQVLAINGVFPAIRALQQGSYPFWSVVHLYTQGDGTVATRSVLTFFGNSQEMDSMPQFGAIPLAMLPATVVATHLPGPEV